MYPRTERYLTTSGIHNFVQQVACDERANITLAYGFCSQALAGDNQKISIEKMLIYYIFTLKKVF